jgi:hypothetical protein
VGVPPLVLPTNVSIGGSVVLPTPSSVPPLLQAWSILYYTFLKQYCDNIYGSLPNSSYYLFRKFFVLTASDLRHCITIFLTSSMTIEVHFNKSRKDKKIMTIKENSNKETFTD